MKSYKIIISSLIVLVLTNCVEVTIPVNDNTLPSVGCVIVTGGITHTLESEGDDINAAIGANDAISIIATGEDKDGGVKSVCIHYTATITYTNGQFSQQNIAPTCSSDSHEPGEVGKKTRIITHVIYIDDLLKDCPEGYWPTAVTGTIMATTENYNSTIKFQQCTNNSRNRPPVFHK